MEGRRVGRRTTGICPQLFPRVFKLLLGSNCFLSALAGSIECLAYLPELLDPFSNRFTPNLKLFCDGRITLPLFIEPFDCFLVYSNRNNVIYIIKLLKCKIDVLRDEMYLQQ